ncbi:MAG: zinc ribbon domain-containing protein [Peptococcia bacterium]
MSDLLGGLGGLMKGLTGFMPQDDPDVKVMMTRTEVSDLQKQETEIYAQIGRQAIAEGLVKFPELESRLRLVQENLSAAQAKLKNAEEEKEAKEAAKRMETAKQTCSSCGTYNPEGVKFCQECGSKLGVLICSQCGASLSPGTRFCGECGARQEE